jgi:hypothetical protein
MQRLGNSITQRRQALQYRQNHRRQLKKVEANSETVAKDAISGTIATTFQDQASGVSPVEPLNQQSRRDSISMFTSATSFLSNYGDGDIGRRIPDLSDMVLDGVQLDYGVLFECPYCRTIQQQRIALNGSQYNKQSGQERNPNGTLIECFRKHVFSDLQPYVCTVDDCHSEPFETRHEWVQHEKETHMLR